MKQNMDIFDFLTMLGGLSLFLFGMSLMGSALERRAGGSLKAILGRLTDGKIAGLLTGLAVTAEGPRKLARLSAKLLGSRERLARMQAAGRKLRSRNGAELIYSCMNNEKSEKQKA